MEQPASVFLAQRHESVALPAAVLPALGPASMEQPASVFLAQRPESVALPAAVLPALGPESVALPASASTWPRRLRSALTGLQLRSAVMLCCRS